ncbi:MAG: Spy/CpxP family protein refolding chaperone [Alphaproteobacteria bacterium]
MKRIVMGIFVAGAMALSAPADARHGHGHHMAGKVMCTEKLSPEKAKMAKDTMHKAMEKNHPLFERMHKAREKMRTIGKAENFDRKAFLAAGDEMANIHMQMAKDRARVMADIAEQLTPQERRDMAECLHSKISRGGKSKHNEDNFNQ